MPQCSHCGVDGASKHTRKQPRLIGGFDGLTHSHVPARWVRLGAVIYGRIWKQHLRKAPAPLAPRLCCKCHLQWTLIEDSLVADALARVAAELVELNRMMEKTTALRAEDL